MAGRGRVEKSVYRRVIFVLAGIACVIAGLREAAAMSLSPAIEKIYSAAEVPPPTATQMTVCYGFVCRLRFTLAFTPADRTALLAILAKGKANALEERKAVQQAVVWFDRRVGREIGTSKRVARADFRFFDDDHNFDCWDTTRNTVGLLLVLQEWGALKHHTVSDPQFRGKFYLGQTPHNTAVLKEKTGAQLWTVDMWTTGFGQVPEVMTLEKWFDEN